MTPLIASHSVTDDNKVWLRAIFWMAVSAFCFAAVETIGKATVRGVSPYELIWARYAVHLLFMGAVLGPRYKTRLVKTNQLKLQIARGLCMLGMPICYLLGAQSLPVNDVWSVYSLSPLIALGLSWLLLHEAAGWQRWAAVLIGFIGALFILRPDRSVLSPAIVFPIGMGACFSLHLALSRILRIEHPVVSLFYTALGVFIPLSLVVPFLWHTPAPLTLLGMILVGLVGMVGLFAFARSSELAPLPVVAAFAYTETLWTLAFNVLLFHELLNLRMFIGSLLVIGMTAYMLFYEARQHKVSEAVPGIFGRLLGKPYSIKRDR